VTILLVIIYYLITIPYFKCRYFNNRPNIFAERNLTSRTSTLVLLFCLNSSSSNLTIILKFIKGGKSGFEFVLPITISCKHGLLQIDFNIELSIRYSIYTIRNYLFKFRFKFINIFNNITCNLFEKNEYILAQFCTICFSSLPKLQPQQSFVMLVHSCVISFSMRGN